MSLGTNFENGQLQPAAALAFLKGLDAHKRQMQSYHVARETREAGLGSERIETWACPGKEHVVGGPGQTNWYYDDLGSFLFTPSVGQLWYFKVPEIKFLPTWIDSLYGPGIHELSDVRVIRDGTNFRIEGYMPSRKGPTKVTEWVSQDYTPLKGSFQSAFRRYQGSFQNGTESWVNTAFRKSNGFTYPSVTTRYWNGKKWTITSVKSASISRPAESDVNPPFLQKGLTLHVRPKGLVYVWNRNTLLAANHGSSKIDTKQLLKLTKSRVDPMEQKFHAKLVAWRNEVIRTGQAQANPFPVSKEIMQYGVGALALAVLFVISASRTLRHRTFN